MFDKKVILFENNPLHILFLTELLNKWQIKLTLLHQIDEALMKINLLKPDILLLSTDLKIDYNNLLNFLERKNLKVILYGKEELSTKWTKSPIYLAFCPPPIDMNLFAFQTLFFPQLKTDITEDEIHSHIDSIIVRDTCIIELSGKLKWEDIHHMKFNLYHHWQVGSAKTFVFIFSNIDNLPEDLTDALSPMIPFTEDVPILEGSIFYVNNDSRFKSFFFTHPFFKNIPLVKNCKEAFLKIENLNHPGHPIGVDVYLIKPGKSYGRPLYDFNHHLIQEQNKAFTTEQLNQLKKDGIDWLFFESEIRVIDDDIQLMEKNKNRKIILLIDDDNNIQKLLSYFLKKIGYDVQISSDAVFGLKFALTKNPSLILLDLNLPGINGIEFYKKYKEEIKILKQKESPVIVLSGISKRNIVEILFKMGISDYIVKPFDFKTIEEKITNILNNQETN